MRIATLAAGLLLALIALPANAQALAEDDPWPQLVTDVFSDRPILDGTGVLALEAPYRAEDAAIVPITIRSELPGDSPLKLKAVTLVIDKNPSPVAAVFSFGPQGGVREISTRVRVNTYSNIHAVAELSDGKLYSVVKFVKASGGCSAPALKSPEEAFANAGEMRMRWFERPGAMSDGLLEAQLMIRHPNFSGLQMDQITRNYIPADFVRDLKVSVGDELLFRVEGGISISENPSFRFTYADGASRPISVEGIDTEDRRFQGSWPVTAPDGAA